MVEIEVYVQSAVCNVPSLVTWVLLAVLIVGSISILWIKGWQDGKNSVARLMMVEWVALVFCTTVLFRETRAASSINLIPFWSYFLFAGNSYLKEMLVLGLLNMVMFVPVGFLLKCGFRCIIGKQTFLAGIILSITIELLQFLLCKGLCELDDVIHNVLGCMIGYGIVSVVKTISVIRR